MSHETYYTKFHLAFHFRPQAAIIPSLPFSLHARRQSLLQSPCPHHRTFSLRQPRTSQLSNFVPMQSPPQGPVPAEFPAYHGDSPPLALDFCRPCALSASAGADEWQARPFAGNAPPAAGSPVAHDLVLSQWHRPPVGGRRRRVPSRPVRSRRESRQAANAGGVGISQRKARQRRIDRLPARGKLFGSPDATRRRNSWPRPTKAPLKSFSDTRIACEAR